MLLPTKVFSDRGVHVPTLEAAKVTPAATVVVESQNARTERRLNGRGIGEHIQPGSVSDGAVDCGHAAVQVIATEERAREAENCIFGVRADRCNSRCRILSE